MSGIFISYRRMDSAAYARGLNDVLSRVFGDRRVFIDIHDVQRGTDYVLSLDDAIGSADVLLALVGPHWLTLADATGRRRLDNQDDWVRQEIATALASPTTRVIPVLVGGASMPDADDLPEDLKPLAHRQAIELTDNRWDYDVGVLVDDLKRVVAPVGPAWPTRLRHPIALALVAGALAMAVVVAMLLNGLTGDDPPDSDPDVAVAVAPTQVRAFSASNQQPAGTSPVTPLATLQPEGWVASLAFTPDGTQLASGADDGAARMWLLAEPTAEPIVRRGGEPWVTAVAVSPDGSLLATGADTGTVRVWDLARPDAEPTVLSGHSAWVNALAFSADGARLASGADDGTARIWNLADPASPMVLERGGWVMSIAFSPDGRFLATGSDDGTVQIWDLTAPGTPVVVERDGWATAVAWSPDGTRVATGTAEGTIRVWDPAAPDAEPVVLRGHAGQIRVVAFSPDGVLLASGGDDGTARLWRPGDPGAEAAVLERHSEMIPTLAFSPDGTVLATGGGDGTVRLWNVETIAPEAG